MTAPATVTLPRVTLGRRGLGADYDRWCAYACLHLDESAGFVVNIVQSDSQADEIILCTEDQRHAIASALEGIFDAWRALGAGRPEPLVIGAGRAQLHVAGAFLDVHLALHRLEAVTSAIARQLDRMSPKRAK